MPRCIWSRTFLSHASMSASRSNITVPYRWSLSPVPLIVPCRPIALFLLLSGVVSALKGRLIHARSRSELLDAIDRKIEGEAFDQAFSEWTNGGEGPGAVNGLQVTPFIHEWGSENLGYRGTISKRTQGIRDILAPVSTEPKPAAARFRIYSATAADSARRRPIPSRQSSRARKRRRSTRRIRSRA